jgi:hypothetical protein
MTDRSLEDLEWLQEWYSRQCNGEWEHSGGVRIETIDNPGWWVRVSLAGTELAYYSQDAMIITVGSPPTVLKTTEDRMTVRDGGPDWMACEIKAGQFSGAGDPKKLGLIIKSFRDWATSKK